MNQPFNFPIPEVDLSSVLPVIILAIAGMLALIVELIRPKHNNDLIVGLSLGSLVLAGYMAFQQIGVPPYEAMGGMVVRDAFAGAMQVIVILSAALCVLFSEPYLRQKRIAYGEFYPMLLWSTVGALFMVSTRNLLMVFLGLEILSIAIYVMAGLSRHEERSEESAMKYFLLGSFASAFLLFGIAFLYGATGSLHLDAIGVYWNRGWGESRMLILFGLGLLLVGLGFKTSLVPFHQWTPDVYQGAPTNVTAFMATVSKVAAFGTLWRVMEACVLLKEQWIPVLTVVAGLTMIVGNVLALTQKDVKRILAFSSIANAGYALVAVIARGANKQAVDSSALVYFLLSYALMSIGAFAVLTLVAKDGKERTSIDDLRGLWKRSPVAAIALLVCMLSLIGVPPTAGFVGKAMIFVDAIRAGLTPLAIVLGIGSAISIYYYLAIATAAFAADEDETKERVFAPTTPVLLGTCVVCVAGVLGIAVFFGPVMGWLGQ